MDRQVQGGSQFALGFGGLIMEYLYIPLKLKGELVKSGVGCNW